MGLAMSILSGKLKTVDDFARRLSRYSVLVLILGILQFILWGMYDRDTSAANQAVTLILSICSVLLAVVGYCAANYRSIPVAILAIFLDIVTIAMRVATLIVAPDGSVAYTVLDIIMIVLRLFYGYALCRFVQLLHNAKSGTIPKSGSDEPVVVAGYPAAPQHQQYNAQPYAPPNLYAPQPPQYGVPPAGYGQPQYNAQAQYGGVKYGAQ